MEWWKIVAAGILIAAGVTACNIRDAGLVQKGVDQQLAVEAKQKEKDHLAAEAHDAQQAKAMRAIEEQHVREKQENEKAIAGLQRDVRDGRERLRIAIVRNSGKTPTDPATSGAEPEEGSVVMPETASDILGIAAGVGQNVRDYNDLLDAYRALERRCTQ